jgi:hypothetical protein
LGKIGDTVISNNAQCGNYDGYKKPNKKMSFSVSGNHDAKVLMITIGQRIKQPGMMINLNPIGTFSAEWFFFKNVNQIANRNPITR